MATKGKAIGDKLGSVIDEYAKARSKRKLADSQAEALKKIEDGAKAKVIAELQKNKLDSARGERGQATITMRDIAAVEDWPALYKHIRETDEFELLQKRPALGACQERWEQKVMVPGVKHERMVDLKFTEAK